MQAKLVFELHGECAEHDTGDEHRCGDGYAVGHRASYRSGSSPQSHSSKWRAVSKVFHPRPGPQPWSGFSFDSRSALGLNVLGRGPAQATFSLKPKVT
jgi:hypothetical protein